MWDDDPEKDLPRENVGASTADPNAPLLKRMVAELVLDTTNEGVWLIDAQSRTTFVNRAAAELLGYAEDEMIGRSVFDFLERSRHATVARNLMLRRAGIEARGEGQLRRKDGTLVWVIGSANPVYDRNGRYAGALALLGDLTAQKHTEAQLRAEVSRLGSQMAAASPTETPRPSLTREAIRAATIASIGGAIVGLVGVLSLAGMATALLLPPSRSLEEDLL